MGFKEYLKSTGLTDEQADKVIAGMPAAKLFLAAEENLDVRYSKAKTDLEQAQSDLAAANKLVSDLKKGNKDNDDLQGKVTTYEKQIADLEKDRNAERAEWQVKEALKDAKDPEYALWKLKQEGELELDDKGKVKNLTVRVKSLKEASPALFNEDENQDDKQPDGKGGYTVVNNELKDPKKSGPLDISKMSADEINKNWDAIVAQEGK